MSVKERIFHSILFEIIALTILVVFSQLVSDHNPKAVGGLAITLSLIAMSWNYVYNLGFDKLFGTNRLSRGFWLRVSHGAGFEAGLLTVTTPLIMWVLKEDLMTVIALNLGLATFFVLYAIVFNWAYDNLLANLAGTTTS